MIQHTLKGEFSDIYHHTHVDSRYWLIPPELYQIWDNEFHFDFDPCPFPYERDGIEIDWGEMNWVNPPFRKKDSINSHGPTAFVRKAIEEQARLRRQEFSFQAFASIVTEFVSAVKMSQDQIDELVALVKHSYPGGYSP